MNFASPNVCLEPSQKVENFLSKLDDVVVHYIHHKISAAKDRLTPGHIFEVVVKISEKHRIAFTCVGYRTHCIEIHILSYYEKRPRLDIKKAVIAFVGITLTLFELLYYGGHVLELGKSAVHKMESAIVNLNRN